MKFVKVQLNHTNKVYEYMTELPLEVGKTYRITEATSWVPPMRVKVLSESDTPEYKGPITEIKRANEAEAF